MFYCDLKHTSATASLQLILLKEILPIKFYLFEVLFEALSIKQGNFSVVGRLDFQWGEGEGVSTVSMCFHCLLAG